MLCIMKKATREHMSGVIITDSDPAIYRAVLIEYLTTHYIFCIWHIKENLKKILYIKLGIEFDTFTLPSRNIIIAIPLKVLNIIEKK